MLAPSESALADTPDRFVTSPAHGRFEPRPPGVATAEGELVEAGQTVAVVASRERAVPVVSPWTGWLIAYLVQDGERVRPGDALVQVRVL